MKIIELINKIANDEEVPKKVRYKNDEWEFYKEYNDYLRVINGKNGTLFTYYILKEILNDEVEIIEDKPKFEVDEKGFIHTNSGAWKGRKIDIEFAKALNYLLEKSISND